jgi:hypothetical protein
MSLKNINININTFIIFAHPRSGSSSLYDIMELNNINIVFEPFNTDHYNYKNLIGTYGYKNIVDKICHRKHGFKHLFDHSTESQNKYLLEKFPCIFLYRKDVTEAAISYELSMKTKIWAGKEVNFEKNYIENIKNYKINEENEENEENILPSIDPKYIKNTIDFYYNGIKLYKRNIKNGYVIEYENLFGPDGFEYLKEIMKFLNIKIINEKETLEILNPIRKLNKKPWNEVIGNWKEISPIIEMNKNKILL